MSTTAGTSTMTVSGYIGVAASSTTPTSYVFRIDGPGGYLQFPDGTMQTSAGDVLLASTQTFTGANTFQSSTTFTGVVSGVSNSSSTLLSGGDTVTQTTFANCISGSTLTITTSGGRVMVGFSGAVRHNAAGGANFLGYKVDGVSVYGPTIGIINITTPQNNYDFNASFTHITGVLSAGSHSFCLDYRVSANEGTFQNAAGLRATPQFWVQELR